MCATLSLVDTLPNGTVSFLFTDLEGSTRLWESSPDLMPDALARHDDLLRTAVESNDGHVVKTTGDGVHAATAATSRPRSAAQSVVDAPGPVTPAMGSAYSALTTTMLQFERGDEGIVRILEGVERCSGNDDPRITLHVSTLLSGAAMNLAAPGGNLEAARGYAEQALVVAREMRSPTAIALAQAARVARSSTRIQRRRSSPWRSRSSSAKRDPWTPSWSRHCGSWRRLASRSATPQVRPHP